MGKLEEFLLAGKLQTDGLEEKVTVSKRFPAPFLIKAISEKEHKALRRSCQKTELNPRTGVRETVTDADSYFNRLIAACTVEPNFKNAALQEAFGVLGAEALVDAMLLPGEFDLLLEAVQKRNGFDRTLADRVDEAKN